MSSEPNKIPNENNSTSSNMDKTSIVSNNTRPMSPTRQGAQKILNGFDEIIYNGLVNRAKQTKFEEFIAVKHLAFYYYYLNPQTKHLIDEKDVKYYEGLKNGYYLTTFTFFLGTCMLTKGITYMRDKKKSSEVLKKRRLLRFAFRYLLIPGAVAKFIQHRYLNKIFDDKMNTLYSKYNFHDEVFKNNYPNTNSP